MAHKDNLRIFEQALNSLLKATLRVKLEVVEGLVILGKEEEKIVETPFLRSALDLFSGKIIKKA